MHRFNHNPEQQGQLKELMIAVAQELLSLNFIDPTEDHKRIRRHAWLKGRYELLQTLLDDDFPEPHVEIQNEE